MKSFSLTFIWGPVVLIAWAALSVGTPTTDPDLKNPFPVVNNFKLNKFAGIWLAGNVSTGISNWNVFAAVDRIKCALLALQRFAFLGSSFFQQNLGPAGPGGVNAIEILY